jgi:glucosylceramidase
MKIRITKLNRFLFSMVLVSGLLACNQKEAEADKASLWLTTLDKESLLEKKEVLIKDKNDNTQEKGPTITIDTSQTFQEMDGFGYTLTGGSALHLNKMSDSARSAILQELFGTGKDDLGVSYLRLSIGASDLDKEPFSYNDLPKGETDVNLENFSLANDTLNLIPVVKEILKIAPEIKILGSPWSPPVWMKDNKDTRGGSLMEEYYPVYAKYFVKYIEAMKEQGINIDAITIQNEPLHPGNNPSMLMLAEDQAAFIKDHLGPVFEEHHIDTKIILYDHNADRPDYPISILNDPEVAKYVDGSAFHLYGGEIEALSEVHRAHPDKNLYFTEQWVGAPGDFAQEMSWHTENLIIGAPRNWSKNVLEWNLAADENQEPHTDRGGCDRCLGAITINGDKVIREPAYYIIGQASKFVRPGSVRVASNETEHIANVAYLTPDGEIAIILQNTSDKDQAVDVELGNRVASLQLPAGAVGTLVM